MTSKERRTRKKQDLERGILDAARYIAFHDGWQNVTVRKIADRIEYTPPAIYEFFESKQAVLYRLMQEGFVEILAEMKKAGDLAAPGAEAIEVIGDAIWGFAFRRKELYQVMHSLGGVPFGTEKTPPEAMAAFRYVYEALERGKSKHSDREVSVEMLWALLHGWISLTMAGRIRGGEKRARRGMKESLRILLRGLFEGEPNSRRSRANPAKPEEEG